MNEFGELSGDETTQSEDNGDDTSEDNNMMMDFEAGSLIPDSPYMTLDTETSTTVQSIDLMTTTDPCVEYFSEASTLKFGDELEVMNNLSHYIDIVQK